MGRRAASDRTGGKGRCIYCSPCSVGLKGPFHAASGGTQTGALTPAPSSAIVPSVQRGPIAIAGGGAAGFFAAITCAGSAPKIGVVLLERGPRFLSKVRISGGGRCNVTHACFDPVEFAMHYPRGGRELLGPFSRFQARDTVAWFESRGVPLKVESDGRIFPRSDSSEDVVRCLQDAATGAGVDMRSGCGVEGARKTSDGNFELTLSGGRLLTCSKLLTATGGCRTDAAARIPVAFGHTLEPPVPSLFSFHAETQWTEGLAGVSVDPVEVRLPGTTHRALGAVLFTHAGLSGPAILALSSWGARELHDCRYRFRLRVSWLAGLGTDAIRQRLESLRERHPGRMISTTTVPPIPLRLWQSLIVQAGLKPDTRWAGTSRASIGKLSETLASTDIPISGKSLNKDEFVTCGGLRLAEVDFRTMESRICPGLHFAGEVLDIDGVTGGFNFQSAWTTGWIAGHALARTTA